MKELYAIENANGYTIIDSQRDDLLQHDYLRLPFVIVFYNGDDEEDACFTTVYTKDYQWWDSYETFSKRIRNRFMNWYSKHEGIALHE